MSSSAATGARIAIAVAIAIGALPTAALAQSSPGWFVPKQSGAAAPAAAPHHGHHAAAQAAASQAGAPPADLAAAPDAQGSAQSGPPPVLPLPPIPGPGNVPKGAPPPAAVIGVISVPDIMHASTAAEQVERVLGARRDKLNGDVQREQLALREIQQTIEEGKGLSPDQQRARARALVDRERRDQDDFKNRQRVIQEAAQVALGQIERELVQVIRQVAASRGMNLVLHQEQIALNIQPFDISQQVATQLNAVLPSVFIPADGVDPEQLAKDGTFPTTAEPQLASRAPGAGQAPGGSPVKVSDPGARSTPKGK